MRDQGHQGGESMSPGDPEADHLAGAGQQGRQVCGGDDVDADGGKHRGGEAAADPDPAGDL